MTGAPPPNGFIPAAAFVLDLDTKLSKLTKDAPAPPRKSEAVFFAGAVGALTDGARGSFPF